MKRGSSSSSNRRLSQVSKDDQSELNEKLKQLYDEFCDGAPIMTRKVLINVCTECSILDKKLAVADVELVFQRVKVGKNPGEKPQTTISPWRLQASQLVCRS
jgi:hypothetical protein